MKAKSHSELPEKILNVRHQIEEFMAFLNGQKAVLPVSLEIAQENSIIDGLIIAGATSRRHAQGLADGLSRLCHEKGYEFLGMEGYDLADWILLDCNAILVNILQEDARKLYKLEDLWTPYGRSQEIRS